MIDKISSEFNRNVFTLTFASGIAQAIPLLLSPILVKIYTSKERSKRVSWDPKTIRDRVMESL